MPSPRLVSWLPVAAVLALAGFGIVGLLLGIAGDRKGMQALPDSLGSTVHVLHDPVAGLSFADALARPESDWISWDGEGYIRALYREAVWVRVTLQNPSPLPVRGVLADDELIIDRLDCWTPDAGEPGGWLHQVSGETVPGRLKSIRGRETAVYITVPPRGEVVAYLRAKDHFQTWFRAVWWPEASAFLARQLRHTLAEGLYFGVLVALLIYNAVLWVRLRHRDLGHYLGYLGSMAVFMALSRAQPQLLGFPLGSPLLEPLVTTALAATGFFFVRFSREFFGLRAVAPRMDLVARALGWLNLGFALGAPALLWSETSLWMHIVIPGLVATHITLLVIAVLVWRLGVLQARFFLLSFGVFLLGGTPFVYYWMRAIPLGDSAIPLMIGSALEMLLLSLAVADRFARISRDRQAALLAEEKARLELLRYQLNPHFLFNALNSIYGLVYPHSRAAGDLVRRLADFCRGTFAQRGDQWRTLGEEFDMLRTYLDIEQARWRDGLVVEISASPEVADAKLPAFLLLPLVENAIKHGGATSPDLLTVRVTARDVSPDAFEIEIANTGRWQSPDEPRQSPSHGIGMDNVRARLERNYPGVQRLDIASRDGWVSVVLRLPRSRVEP